MDEEGGVLRPAEVQGFPVLQPAGVDGPGRVAAANLQITDLLHRASKKKGFSYHEGDDYQRDDKVCDAGVLVRSAADAADAHQDQEPPQCRPQLESNPFRLLSSSHKHLIGYLLE